MTDASWVERAVLVVILLTSLTLFWWRFQKVLHIIRGSRATTDFEVSPLGTEDQAVPVGSHAAGEGDRAAPPSRLGARLRVLGFSGLRPGHHQSPCVGLRWTIPVAGFGLRQLLFIVRRGVGGGGGRLDRGPVRAPLRRAARVVGQSRAGIGIHRLPDLHADGRRILPGSGSTRNRSPGRACGGCTRWRC